jgi:hypothetical protein
MNKNSKAARSFPLLILVLFTAIADCAHAQSGVSYCADVKRVIALATTNDRFASIAGKPRDGNFSDTTLALAGWKDCSLYGPAMYTCDSVAVATLDDAAQAQARIVDQLLTCLAGEWAEIGDFSSPGYVVLHPVKGPASITLNLYETENKQHIVRLILFIRNR